MVDAIEQEYDEKEDLAAVIDKRLQVGITAGKIYIAQATANTLTKLLIDKGIFTSEEFVAIMREKEKTFNKAMKGTIAGVSNATPSELNETERFMQTITDGFNNVCEKVSEK